MGAVVIAGMTLVAALKVRRAVLDSAPVTKAKTSPAQSLWQRVRGDLCSVAISSTVGASLGLASLVSYIAKPNASILVAGFLVGAAAGGLKTVASILGIRNHTKPVFVPQSASPAP